MKTSMRYLAVIFAVAMMLCALTVSAAFADVKSDTPHAKAIESLTSLGVLHGYEDGNFKPDLPVRRDEMAKLVYTTFTTLTDAGDGVVTFPDVPANSWAKGYISWCAGKNIVGGYEDGTFKPEGNVTYDEALKMICAMLGYVDFKPEMWPVDVRLKALIDLNLGEELADVTGDAVLTRAQVAQLFQNSLDEQMYTTLDDNIKVGSITLVKPGEVSTLARDVWGYTELDVRIVGTENYNIKALYKVKDGVEVIEGAPARYTGENTKAVTVSDKNIDYITYPKSAKADELVLAYLDENDEFVAEKVEVPAEGETPASYYYEPKTLTLSLDEIKLDAYEGKTDELIARDIKIFINKEGEYFSSTLKGKVVEGITGAGLSTAGFANSELGYTHGGNKNNSKYAILGIKIDGVEYRGDNFNKLRNLSFLPGGEVLSTPTYGGAHLNTRIFVDDDMNLINIYYYEGINSDGSATPYLDYTYNFPSLLARSSSYASTRKGIDSDGDGYFDYVNIAFTKPYKVTAVSRTSITLQSMDDTSYSVIYKGDKFHSEIDRPKVDDVIFGYIIADDFYHQSTAKTITAFATKYSLGSSSSSVTLYGFGSYSTATNLHTKRNVYPGNSAVKSVVSTIEKDGVFMGYDDTKGGFNYATYYLYGDKIVYARLATENEIKNAAGGQNKAILQFVDKPTDWQVNEKTKKYEIFYPAYLIINGKEELVNLKGTNAINGVEAATVAQNGSMYRAYLAKDGKTVMYPNILVEYEVDNDGYYSLKTTSGENKDIEEEGKLVGKIIGANGYYLTINSSTGIMAIKDKDGNVIQDKVYADGKSVIYFPYVKKTTGEHQFIDFCLGTEIPEEFKPIEITGDTYLNIDNETGFYMIETTMLALGGFDEVAVTVDAGDYKTDARLHLLSRAESEAEYDEAKEETYATYSFEGIYEGTDIVTTNKDTEYKDATKAEIGGLYAWDSEKDDYVDLSKEGDITSLTVEVVKNVMLTHDLVFTDANVDGYKIGEDVKIIAVKNTPNEENEEFVYEIITIDDIETLLETVQEYNDYHNEGADYTISARIGTYVDNNKDTQVAYIILDWFEFNEELDAYTNAGVIVK